MIGLAILRVGLGLLGLALAFPTIYLFSDFIEDGENINTLKWAIGFFVAIIITYVVAVCI